MVRGRRRRVVVCPETGLKGLGFIYASRQECPLHPKGGGGAFLGPRAVEGSGCEGGVDIPVCPAQEPSFTLHIDIGLT